jgi:hypothetical protein
MKLRQRWDIQKKLVPDLLKKGTTIQNLDLGKEYNIASLWYAIIEHEINLSVPQLMEIGNSSNNASVWSKIIKSSSLTTEELLVLGAAAGDWVVWNDIVPLLKKK